MKNIILFGPPGSGKSTFIEMLNEKGVSFSLINPGQILRDISQDDSDFSRKIRETMAKGDLADDFLVTELVKKKVREIDKNKPIIFDGYPRNLGQVNAIDEIFTEIGLEPPVLVHVKITKEEAVKRLSARRVCSVCEENFQLQDLADPEKCPKCNGKIIQREDDKPESIENRFEIFNMQFEIIKYYFESKGRYYEIDGKKERGERVEELIKIIQS